MNAYEKVVYILQNTNDGNDLSPEDLSLLQNAVNGWLTEQGEIAFCDLYNRVKNGYQKPWFHDIENLTIDHVGYVYWKGKNVEHYNFSWAWSEEAKKEAQELAKRCQTLEKLGIEVNTTNVIWKWDELMTTA